MLNYTLDDVQATSRALGYASIKDFVKATFRDFNAVEYLEELYEVFLMAVQQGAPRLDKKRIWDENSIFEDFCQETKVEIGVLLEQLKLDLKEKHITFSGVENFAAEMAKADSELSPAQKASGIILPQGAGHVFDAEDYEWYDFVLRKSKEAIENFVAGRIKLEDKDKAMVELRLKEEIAHGKARTNVRTADGS